MESLNSFMWGFGLVIGGFVGVLVCVGGVDIVEKFWWKRKHRGVK